MSFKSVVAGFSRPVVVASAVLAGILGTGWSGGNRNVSATPRVIGTDRIVSVKPLGDGGEDLCDFPAGPDAPSAAARLQGAPAAAPAQGGDRPGGAARAAVAERKPVRIITDPNFAFAGVAVDPARNEVVLADENISAIVVYDRLTNTPATMKSEPKRVIEGTETFIEYASSLYIDPGTGDIFNVNNDTMNWLPVFGREAHGNVAPKRVLQTPHTTFGIASDEAAGEIFLTIQDDHAVVVFDKQAKDVSPDASRRTPTPGPVPPPSPLRILQGARTQMADPHGIALDPKRGEIFVTNWGLANERPPLANGGGAGSVNRNDFPVGRRRAFRGSGTIDAPSITVYPKGASGDTPPLRVIKGPKTMLNWPTAVAAHPDRGELFVASDVADAVLVFRADANGDVAPLRILKGPRSLIKNPTGVAVDATNNELWVANFGNHTATVYRLDANGDAPPLRVIRSAPADIESTMLNNPHTATFDSKRDELLVAS